MARIVTVYRSQRQAFQPVDMSYIRWLKISEALACAGHEVDIASNEPRPWWRRRAAKPIGTRLRRVPLEQVRWSEYDVVKTLFHAGFETLETFGGTGHPFIISKLGSVVGPTDMDGIHFYGDIRRRLYETQQRIARTSAYVTVLTAAAAELWRHCFGAHQNLLLVPGAVDRFIPPRGADPYPRHERLRCLFAGNVYVQGAQPEANRVLVNKLNALGAHLQRRDAGLYLLGPGDVSRLDRGCVTALGAVPYDAAWQYIHHAEVGVVVAAGSWSHNNESSKIYHYLRAGLPVVTEGAFPNAHLVRQARLGFVVPSGDMEVLAEHIERAAGASWDRRAAADYIVAHHTWDHRAGTYDRLIREVLHDRARSAS